MAVMIEKQRRARLVRTNRRTEDEPWQIRAEYFSPPEGAMDCGDGVYARVTLLPDREIYETWTVRPLPVVH